MYLVGVIVLSALSSAYAGWLEELTRGRGLDLGSGVSLHLDRLKRENGSLLEKHALRLDYSGLGFSVGKALNKDALQFGIYTSDEVEGRKRQVGNVLVPTLIGFKVTGIAAVFFTAVTLLVFKALAVAKLGFLVSAGLLIAQYFHQPEKRSHVEIEHVPTHDHLPGYNEYPQDNNLGESANYYPYANYGTADGIGGSESAGQYAIVEAPAGNSSAAVVPAGKRHDFLRHKFRSTPFLTVRKYTIQH